MGLPTFTNLDNYYDDESVWGDYQYTTLEQIVNNFMAEQGDDSYVANEQQSRVALFAKKAIRELYFDVANEVIAIEMDLNPALIIPLPHDYINYVRISWVDTNGKLHPLAIDRNNNLAQAYLQDNNYDFLYDINGDILKGSHVQNTPASNSLPVDSDPNGFTSFGSNFRSKPFNTNMSKIFKNGSFRIDKEQGVIQFSSEVDGRTIVLEYISDGLYQRTDAQIKVHKFAEEAVYDYIYWNLIRRRRSVHNNEKETARRDWFNSRRIAKKRISPITYEDIRQVLKGSSKWIKD